MIKLDIYYASVIFTRFIVTPSDIPGSPDDERRIVDVIRE